MIAAPVGSANSMTVGCRDLFHCCRGTRLMLDDVQTLLQPSGCAPSPRNRKQSPWERNGLRSRPSWLLSSAMMCSVAECSC